MDILIPGGTGQLGNVLTRAFTQSGNRVTQIGRNDWNSLQAAINHADVVINLAGRSVNCRYTARNRQQIYDSRLSTTKAIGEVIRNAPNPPPLWLQMSTATIYAHRYDAANDEATGILGTTHDDVPETWRFSHDVALKWEHAATNEATPNTRKVLLRTAMVMSPDKNGVFDVLTTLVRRSLGGTNGDGRQYVSWIHEQDFVRAIAHLIDHPEIDGPVNLASPNPLPNKDFMATLRQVSGTRIGLPATNWMLELGALVLDTETELILKSRRVIPGRLLDSGFTFGFPDWSTAASVSQMLGARWSTNFSEDASMQSPRQRTPRAASSWA